MRRISLLFCLLVVAFIPAHAGHSPPKLILRVHVQTNGDGMSAQQAVTLPIPPNGEIIQIRALPEATEQELTGVAETNGTVRLQFNHAGMVALSAATAENQGRLLVVIMNGRVVYAPIIDTQITSGELDIPRNFDPRIVALLQDIAQKNVRKANKA